MPSPVGALVARLEARPVDHTYDIVTQQYGGTIVADSNVGEYSEFTIRLPRNP